MGGLSNCWHMSTWHMNLRAVSASLGPETGCTRVKRKRNSESSGAFAAAPFILAGARPSNITMTHAHTRTTVHTWWVGQ